ncbi:MAG: hypothetical protein IV097_00495 [Burkholderiaceae bacterium]|nr:hypothetical protein [Burkholderiaceae bacterium]
MNELSNKTPYVEPRVDHQAVNAQAASTLSDAPIDVNPKDVPDDPEPIVDRDPNSGLIEPTPEWIQWHLSFPLTQDEIVGLRKQLTENGDENGLAELASIEHPTRFDYRQLANSTEAKYLSRSNLQLMEW